jgi:hypothetical protein
MPESNFLEKEIGQLEERFIGRLKLFDNLSRSQQIQLAYETDFFAELEKLGLTRILQKLNLEYGSILKDIAKYKTSGISALTYQDLDSIMQLDAESILRRAQAYAVEFKSSLIKGFVAGEDTDAIRSRITDIGLKTNWTISAINTAKDQFNSVALSKLFEDEPERRFKLSGPFDAKTRCECKAVLTFQPKNGFTKKEIDEGAWHKIAIQHCAKYNERFLEGKQAKYGFINRAGFGCRHFEEVVE